MDTPRVATNIRADLKARPTRIAAGGVLLFAVFFLLGSLSTFYPYLALGCFAAVATLGFGLLALTLMRGAGLEVWQVLLLIALTGYTLLNYGFENLTIHLGIPLIISYQLMFLSLALATFSHPHLMTRAWKEPAMLCVLAMLLLASLHLVLDVPTYGLWAIRDASMFIDGLFMVLGLLWAMSRNCTISLMKWLMAFFVANLVYSFTFPWGEKISAWSPKSGVFLQVPILGNYRGNAIFLLLGALFCMFLGQYVVRWPRWIILFLAMAQLSGLAIHQARALYVGLAVVLVILVLSGETGKAAKLMLMFLSGFAGLLLLTSLGVEIQGRIGPVNADFLMEHLRSISGAEGTPGSSLEGRFDWTDQALKHFYAHPVVGEGFGMVLIDFTDYDHSEQAAVRQPHNSTLSLLARLGAIGIVPWVMFHWCLVKRFVYAFRQRRCFDKRLSDFLLWLFMVYVIFMIESSVEPMFEFPSGAIPFFFFMGFALGLIRWRVPQKSAMELPTAAPAQIVSYNMV
jgi:hypothetical protein